MRCWYLVEKEDLPDLPRGWAWTKFEQIICDSLIGLDKRRALQSKIPEGSPYFKMNNITTDGRIITDEIVYVKVSEKEQVAYLLKENDLLFNTRNSNELVGKTGIVKIILKNSIYNNNIMRIRVSKGIIPDFICYQMCSPKFKKKINLVKRATTNVAAIYAKDLFPLNIVLAPTLEQHRIVSKIEELFTKLDAGKAALHNIKALSKVYHQAVLKAAMTGKLTDQWRAEHKDEMEPASVLLEKIKEERKRKLWKKYKELSKLEPHNLPQLPEEWIWTTLEDISVITSGGTPSTSNPENFGGNIPWITPADLSKFDGKFISKGSRNITDKGLNSSSAVLLPKGTVIFSSRAPIGYVAIAQNELCTNQGFKNFIPYKGILNEYLFYYLKGNKSLAEKYASGTTFLELSAGRVSKLPVPLAPLLEQEKIVEEVEHRFSVIDDITKTVIQGIEQAERLQQCILKQAFAGKLVPQDPTDEPATVLIERIKTEKEKLKTTTKKKKRKEK